MIYIHKPDRFILILLRSRELRLVLPRNGEINYFDNKEYTISALAQIKVLI